MALSHVLVCLCLAALCLAAPSPFQAQESHPAANSTSATGSIGKIGVTPRADGLTIAIAVTTPVKPEATLLHNPDRLVIDFPGCDLTAPTRHIPVNSGPVKGLRLSQFSLSPPVTRVVVDLDARPDFQLKPAENGIVAVEINFPKAQSSSPAPARAPAIAEKNHAAPMPPAPKPIEPAIAKPPANPQQGAYGLMTKARGLSVGDLQALEEKAEAGDPEGETMLALAYHAGVLLKGNDAEALRLLHKAADSDYMAAEESLGIFAEAGIGMEKPDSAAAVQWYEKAAQRGSRDAETNIALMYANGRGVAKDVAQAVTWFRRAADGGDPSAQFNLALMYERGEGVPRSYKEALRWLTAAAEQNLEPAILELADFYLQPPDSTTPRDVDKAVRYYMQAADLGSASAQATLGTIFTRGVQGKVDYDQAAQWYQKAAAQGEANGELGLGVSYALGHGVSVDFGEARRLLTASANQGILEAQFDLAIMCEEGHGAPADRDLAAHYYQMAAERGMGKAQYRYGLLLSRGSKSSDDRVAAYKWLMLSQDSIKESTSALSELRKSMGAQEIAQAEREVDNWRLAHRSNAQATTIPVNP